MSYFYQANRLKLGTQTSGIDSTLDVGQIVDGYQGPVYLYDLDSITERYQALHSAFTGVQHCLHYAMKANSHPLILKHLATLGAGADTVSGGEIRLAIAAGFKPERIIFSGVAKTVAEIELAISLGIKQINVESHQELVRISEIAKRLGKQVDIAFRMNPDVNPQTHPYITTGFRENKFGMDESSIPALLAILKESEGVLRLRGLTMHIGSQLFDLGCLREAIQKTVAVHHKLLQNGFALDRIDIGGGLGICYETDDESSEFSTIKAYGQMAQEALAGLHVEILTEPGRILVARSGLLIGEVQYIKKTQDKCFAILNTGMHHLMRPALYGAVHRILPLVRSQGTEQVYDIVGPICESADFLGKNVRLPEIQPGDRIAIADSGAYGSVMASRYNAHELPTELVVSRGVLLN